MWSVLSIILEIESSQFWDIEIPELVDFGFQIVFDIDVFAEDTLFVLENCGSLAWEEGFQKFYGK